MYRLDIRTVLMNALLASILLRREQCPVLEQAGFPDG